MDINEFQSEGLEYNIRITKKKKFFTQSKFGQYNCTIEFMNNLKFPILIINCTELELYICIQRLAELGNNIAMLYSDDDLTTCIEFNSTGDFNNYFWFITTQNIANYPDDYPTDEDIMCSLLIYSNYLNQKSLRISLPMTYSFLEVFIYNIYLVLEDIPYLNEMNLSMIQEFLNGGL